MALLRVFYPLTDLFLVSSSHNVPVGLSIVSDALAAEVFTQLVNKLTLLPVHRRE